MTYLFMLLGIFLFNNSYSIPSLKVTPVAIGNLLEWESINAGGEVFIIQRSTDGLTFEDIGIVKREVKGTKPYFFLDRAPKQDRYFYRIVMSEVSSEIFYRSKICIANRKENLAFRIGAISDTSTDDVLELTYYTTFDGTLDLHLEDKDQKKLKMFRLQARQGKNKTSIKMSTLPLGYYSLILEYGDEQEVLEIRRKQPNSMDETKVVMKN